MCHSLFVITTGLCFCVHVFSGGCLSLFLRITNTYIKYYRITGVGRDLPTRDVLDTMESNPAAKAVSLEQVTQESAQEGFEYLQRDFTTSLGSLLPHSSLCHPHTKELLPHDCWNFSCCRFLSFAPYPLLETTGKNLASST